MTYLTRFDLINNGQFRNRLQMALWIAASDVLKEAANTTNHSNRLEWAKDALQHVSDATEMQAVAVRATTNASIGANGNDSTDGDIQFVVNSLIDELANAFVSP